MNLMNITTTKIGADKQSSMASDIVNTMYVYFQSDKRRMGDLERSIMDSVKRYFEKQPPPKLPHESDNPGFCKQISEKGESQ